MYTRNFLNALIKVSRIIAKVSQFYMQFKGISEQLLADKKINATDQTKLFIKKLSVKI
jgi:rRNA pseudouridine-1189 N-methylase Emg1 (Nep1/Mra1 family)